MILINIGDELLLGQVINTNAAFIGQQMALAGIKMTECVTIGDDESAIRSAIENGFAKTNLIVVTGGLGPTRDDITKKVICDYFHRELVVDEPTLEWVREIFAARGMELTETNSHQADVPLGCTVLKNTLGTAPGLWIEQDGKILVALPGVPFEMEKLICEEVLPRLQEIFHHEHAVLYKVLQCTGISESNLSDQLTDFEAQLPENIKLAYLPKPGIIRLRLTASGANNEELQTSLNQQFEKLKAEVGSLAFADEDIPMEAVIGKLLRGSGRRVATAESCTGGFIAHLITSVPGSSEYFQGSVVSYSNQVKRDILNVREDNLKKRGAVSEPVVSDMALNAMDLLDVDYAVATSGIAGPDGGTAEKPVGTVWIAACSRNTTVTQLMHYGDRRQQTIDRTVNQAYAMLIRLLCQKD